MIERKFIAERVKEFQVHEYVGEFLDNVGYSKTKLVKTPLGEKVVVFASRPGLIVGRKGANIKMLTKSIKGKFHLENPELEIAEVANPSLDADIIAEKIVSYLERFGIQKFKAIGHKIMTEVMGAGALGIEVKISGKVPSSRAKTWRFYQGYLKKSGDVSVSGVRKSHKQAQLKTGIVGIQVRIMPSQTKLPDDISVLTREQLEVAAEAQQKEVKAQEEAKANEPQEAQKPKKKSRSKKAKAQEEKPDESKGTQEPQQ
ncbi:MAG TPA: 30S ribosomal protein S3 [Candidatus Nanoarchaeia archaeon]|nr:30S ribosomal protein S3 [Candidatus Nanoarchaeia archaeon]